MDPLREYLRFCGPLPHGHDKGDEVEALFNKMSEEDQKIVFDYCQAVLRCSDDDKFFADLG
jgi:hypothetical protein